MMQDTPVDIRAAEVLAAAEARRKALVEQDAAQIERILSKDLTYTHTGGNTEDYELHLSRFRSEMRYLKIAEHEISVRVYGSTAVLNAISEVTGQLTGHDPITFSARILQVWVEKNGAWQLVAHQGTKLP